MSARGSALLRCKPAAWGLSRHTCAAGLQQLRVPPSCPAAHQSFQAAPHLSPPCTRHPPLACRRATAAGKGMDMLPTPPPSYAKVPGSFESIARSIRLHMLMDAACKDGGPYPAGEWAPRPGGVRHGRQEGLLCWWLVSADGWGAAYT